MATHIQLSQLLNNLILSSAGDMVNISKTTLADNHVHLQHAHEMIEFLQLESQLQRTELLEKSGSPKSLNNTNTADDSKSLIQPTSSIEVVPDPVQLYSKPIINPWEEIQSNRNRQGLGYVKDDAKLHIPDYSRPIKFVSARFLAQITLASFEKVEYKQKYTQTEVVDKQKYTQTEVAVKPECLLCQRTGHLEDQCFDLHPFHHCGKSNHSSAQCSKQQQSTRLKINYSWIDPWEWSSLVRRLYKFYNRIHSHIL